MRRSALQPTNEIEIPPLLLSYVSRILLLFFSLFLSSHSFFLSFFLFIHPSFNFFLFFFFFPRFIVRWNAASLLSPFVAQRGATFDL